MAEFEFTLKFSYFSEQYNHDYIEEKLYEAGCDDAVLGLGLQSRLALQFTRTAPSAFEAVRTALRQVRLALPEITLIEATPDYVGLTDIALTFGVSRQYLRRVVETNLGTFPMPIHEGNPSLWHLSDVIAWFQRYKPKPILPELIALAVVNKQVNVAKEYVGITPDAWPLITHSIAPLIR